MNIPYEKMDDPETFIPHHMRGGFQRWIEKGVPMGSFGMGILTNDLKTAVCQADLENQRAILSTVKWLVFYAPRDCWGSEERCRAWQGIDKPLRESEPSADYITRDECRDIDAIGALEAIIESYHAGELKLSANYDRLEIMSAVTALYHKICRIESISPNYD